MTPETETVEPTPTPAPDPYAAPGIDVTETKPMVVQNPVRQPDEDDVFTSDQTGLREAAEKVSERRGFDKQEWETKHPVPVEYRAGSPDGPPKPRDETVSAEQSASDLTNFRRGLAEQELDAAEKLAIAELDAQAQLDQTLADAQRAEQIQSQPPQVEPQEAPVPQPPPELPPNSEADKISRLFLQNPELLESVQAYTHQAEQQVQAAQQQAAQYAEAARQQYTQAAVENSNLATAALFAAFPELKNMSVEQINSALPILEKSNPERGAAIKSHLAEVGRLADNARQLQSQQAAAYQQQHRQQFDAVASMADDAYDKWIEQQEPSPQRRQEISATARQMLREAGLSDQEMSYHWSTNPILRSFTGQQIMADAARYRMAQQAARGKVQRPIPTVQRPGTAPDRISADDSRVSAAAKRLGETGSAKDAAAYLIAKRAAARR